MNKKFLEGRDQNEFDINGLKLKELECPICLDIFKNPLIDNCGHTFCKKCIEKFLLNDKNCPFSKNLIKNLFPNLILKNLIFIFKESKKKKKL